ncbi:MAG TPA: ABC transporter permease [Candidatus Saccharimonadales bacterium]|nr:ABC transporter permease [Candidatus Saccharimonadales bacterium]
MAAFANQPNASIASADTAVALTEVAGAPAKERAQRWPRALRLHGHEGVLFIVGVVLVWQFISSAIHFSGKYLFPSPLLTVKTLWASLPELLLGTGYSFVILLPSLALAIAFGVVWGLLVGTTPALNRMFSPFARFTSPVPPTIYIPYAIALLPTFRMAAGFVVFIGVFWPVFLNTANGATAVPQHYRDNARILGLRKLEYLRRVAFPATLPHIFSGIGVGMVFAFIMLTVAELFGASNGLGRFVQLYADYADYPRMVAGILYTGVVVWISMEILERIKKRALFWLK